MNNQKVLQRYKKSRIFHSFGILILVNLLKLCSILCTFVKSKLQNEYKMDINQRIEDLREVMRREHLAACIFPSTDPHQSEYVADHWKGREWISGFNGSAGTAVVTLTSSVCMRIHS